MKLTMKGYLYTLFTVIIVCSLYSCSEESYDVTGNSDNLFYFRRGLVIANKPINSYEFNVIRTPIGEFGDDILVKIPVRATRPVTSAATASAEIDNSLVEEYNAKHGTDYKLFPEGSFKYIKSSVSFDAGTYESYDSLQLSVSKDQFSRFTEPTYLLPIRLNTVTGGTKSSSQGILWTFVNSTFKLINDNVGVAQMQGSLASNCSSWTITSPDEALDFTKCIDGSQSTGVRFANTVNPTIVIDMKSVNKVFGLRILPYTRTGTTYDLSTVKIEFSLDNVNWTSIGTATAMAKDGTSQLIALYKEQEVRYIRLGLTWRNGSTSSTYRNLYEINTYIK